MKFCVDCAHYEEFGNTHRCNKIKDTDIVTGENISRRDYCHDMRGTTSRHILESLKYGPEAKFFEEKKSWWKRLFRK